MSSFGISGTNAHVILEEPEAAAHEPAPETDGPTPWILSAKNPTALRDQAVRLAALPDLPDLPVADVAHTLAERSRFDHRAVIVADHHAALAALAGGETHRGLVTGTVNPGKLAYLFTGQGSQRAGMGYKLYAAFPAYAEAFDAILAHFDPALRDIIATNPDGQLDLTIHTQPALFAVEVALFRLLESWGLRPGPSRRALHRRTRRGTLRRHPVPDGRLHPGRRPGPAHADGPLRRRDGHYPGRRGRDRPCRTGYSSPPSTHPARR